MYVFVKVRDNLQTKADFPFICNSFRWMVANYRKLFLSCLLAHPKWRPMRIILCMLVRTKKMEAFTCLI